MRDSKLLISLAALLLMIITQVAPSTLEPAEAAVISPDDAADRFTAAAYDLFLGRPPSPQETRSWQAPVAFGDDRTRLTRSLATSDEWLGVFVDDLYLNALDRRVDDAGRAFWVRRLQTGQLSRHVAASVYGSDEAYDRAGGTARGFITELYRRMLDRPPDRGGLDYWSNRLDSGRSQPADIVLGLWYSPEFRRLRVTRTYQAVLGRAPDSGGLGFWAERLETSDEIELAAVLAASDEYYLRATGIPAPQAFRPSSSAQQSSTGFANDDAAYLGNPWFAVGVGNVPLKAGVQLSFRFVARRDGPITSSSFYVVENNDGRTGYSSGDCGDLTVELRSDNRGAPSTTVLGRARIAEPCAGPRSGQWLTNLAFERAANVTAGRTYHLVFRNTGRQPNQNWVSVNSLNRPSDASDQVAFSTGGGDYTVLAAGDLRYSNPDGSWGRRGTLRGYFPLFEVYFANGQRQGLSYVGTRSRNDITVQPGGTVARQLLTVDRSRSASAVAVRPYSSAGRLRARITVAGTEVALVNLVNAGGGWYSAVLPEEIGLRPGEVVSVDVIAVSGSARIRALYRANHDDWISNGTGDYSGGHAQVSSGSGFSDHRGDQLQDLPIYLFTG